MSQPDLASRLNEAISLLNRGRRAEARTILLDLSKNYPDMEQVWLWLAATTDDTAERTRYLRRVLELNPRNEKARTAYTRLTGEALAPLPGAFVSTSGRSRAQNIETAVIAVLLMLLIVGAIVLITSVLSNVLQPKPTATTPPTRTFTPTYTVTPTLTITPGGPTFTLVSGITLPPTWTIEPTDLPLASHTPLQTATPFPTATRTPRPAPLKATITLAPLLNLAGSPMPTFEGTLPPSTPYPTDLVSSTPAPTALPTGTNTPRPLTPTKITAVQ